MDDTQNTQAPAPEAAQNGQQAPGEATGTTTVDLTHTDLAAGEQKPADEPTATEAAAQIEAQKPTDAELGAAIVEAESNQTAATSAAPAFGTLAALTGVVSKLESEFESEFRKGETSFKNWYRSVVAELKAHVKL